MLSLHAHIEERPCEDIVEVSPLQARKKVLTSLALRLFPGRCMAGQELRVRIGKWLGDPGISTEGVR